MAECGRAEGPVPRTKINTNDQEDIMSVGKIFKFHNDLDTDQIIASQYLLLPTIDEMKDHTFESLDPDFPKKVKPGDYVVGGENFGCGSSREQAPSVLKALGIQAVVAKSFARIFYRNAINIGLPVIVCKELPDAVNTGDEMELSLTEGVARANGSTYSCTKLPAYMQQILSQGGLIASLNKEEAYSGAVCCAYETVERADRSLPLLIPMSEVAGRMSTQEGRYFLEKPRGGKGKLLGGVPGVKPARVFVIGAGVVGTAAARTAAGTGADVTICDISLQRLTYLADVMPKNVKTLMSSEYNIREELKHADLVIGSVLIPGAKAPKLVTRDMLREMEPGSVMVDVAIDQGGCFETSRPTTHEDPVYYVDGILHYCVANIPGAVPYSSTLALTNATLPYVVQLADKGWRRACKESRELELGLNIVQGKVVYRPVAEAWGLPCEPLAL